MNVINRKIKFVIIFVITIFITSGISIYATTVYFAENVNYKKGNGNVVSVEDALNDLYEKYNDVIDFENIKFNGECGYQLDNRTSSLNLEKGTYLVIVNMGWGLGKSSGTDWNTNGLDGTLTGTNNCVITEILAKKYSKSGNISRLVTSNGIFKVEVETNCTLTYSHNLGINDNNNAEMTNIYALKIK